MSSRTKSRKMALDAIFAADMRKQNPVTLLETTAEGQVDRQNQQEIVGYAKQIVVGITELHSDIDERIASFSHKWSIDRMPAVDRAVLRVAVWEILFNEEVPDQVAISEAVNLAKEYSTEESGVFVNGLLSAISNTKAAK
ncbi:MAG: transcription antitermination factor NusB [Rhodoluna sp.]